MGTVNFLGIIFTFEQSLAGAEGAQRVCRTFPDETDTGFKKPVSEHFLGVEQDVGVIWSLHLVKMPKIGTDPLQRRKQRRRIGGDIYRLSRY
jgi:hypothetical protein